MSRRVEAIRAVPHGIVFIYDPTMIVDVPADTGAAPVLATANCVSVWGQHEDDGPVHLVIAGSLDDNGCSLIFDGTVATEGKRLAISTSDCEVVVEMKVEGITTALQIYSNDGQFPTKIVCVIGPQHS